MVKAKPAARRVYAIAKTYVVALVPAAVALNVVAALIARTLNLPITLNLIGTAVVAITAGPWWGALAAVMTQIISSFFSGPIAIAFAPTGVTAALIWGYGVRWGLGKTFTRFFILSLIVALGVTLVAVPINVLAFGGASGHPVDILTAAFLASGQSLIVAVFSSNILVSLADRIISSFIALAILEALPLALTYNVEVIKAEKMSKIIWITGAVVVGAALALIALMMKK